MSAVCGIVAIFSRREPVELDDLAAATSMLGHRGPDGQRTWIAPHRRIGLGHTRLRVIDLVSGDQPMVNEDGSLYIVVNGEFYDHERIRRELVRDGHELSSRSDSEVALHLYESHGTRCVEHLRGEFAFVIWDEREQTLVAVRDRFGIKPLYYAEVDGRLILASEAKALFAAGVPARWDLESVHQKLHLALDDDRSLFSGVRQVPPGHILLANDGGIRLERYWDASFPITGDVVADEREVIERVREQLLEATRLRLRADVPVGCYLSGGLDSCVVLGLAASVHAGPLDVFTVAFEERGFDESEIAAQMAAKAGANFHRVDISADMRADHYADAIWHGELTHGDGNAVSKYLLSQHVRDHGVRVVLTGEGADEAFAGYPHFRHDAIAHDVDADPRETAAKLAVLHERNEGVGQFLLPTGAVPPMDGVRDALGFVPAWFGAAASRAAWVAPMLDAGFRATFAERDPYGRFLDRIDVAGRLRGRHPLRQSQYLWSKAVLPDIILNVLGDRMEMAHSIEGRLPFLDHHLMATANRLPVNMKIRGLTEKHALRELARPYVTDTVYRRQKHPFVSPPTLGGRFEQLMEDCFHSASFAEVPLFDRDAILSLFDRYRAGLTGLELFRTSWCLMTALSAHTLHTRYHL